MTTTTQRQCVCLLSDTHGRVDERILAEAANCDLVVHSGDIGNAEVLDALLAVCDRVYAVLGNNDLPLKWPTSQHGRLAELPEQTAIALPGGRLATEHGHRVNPVASRHAKLRRRHADCRAVVYGHSHRLVIDQDAVPWVLNPGAAGHERTFDGPSCLLLDARTTGWRIITRRFARH